MSILLLTKIGVLLYKEPSWKYNAHPHDLHFILVNFFFFTFVISLTYLSRYSSSFFLTVCSLLALLLLLLFLSHTACLFIIWSALNLFFRCGCSLHLVQLFFISFFSLLFFFFSPLLSLFITSVQSAY